MARKIDDAIAALPADRQGQIEKRATELATRQAKSMTTHADHRVWQDVYRPSTPAGEVYLKLTVMDDVLIVSFKEL